jgi:hypothetical protein
VTATQDALATIKEALAEEAKNGTWQPAPGDPLHDCEFIRVGFRSWGLEASDRSWRLTLSRLDFGDSNPSALLTAHAPDHANAFGDLGWFVFSHTIGVNGGTNYNQCVARLNETLGGSKMDWGRRIVYLIERSRAANAGSNNGTFSIKGRPVVTAPPPYVFEGRMREGRTISIFGAGSAGKTTLVDGLIASACSGIEIVPGWIPSRQYRTLILDWDEGSEEETIRLAAICEAHEIELTGGYHYKRQTRPLHDIADEIGVYIVANAIDIVIVSPMGRASRNFGENITAPVDEVHEILRSFGTTNILIDHVTGASIKGGAEREFGSVRKRDNVRGSYGVDVQSEEPGTRVLIMRNTKADALSPRQPDQAIRIEFDPPWPKDDGTYDRISFHTDEVTVRPDLVPGLPIGGVAMRTVLHALLQQGHSTFEQLADRSGYNSASIRACLYRYRESWFNRLPSGAWEALPLPSSSATEAVLQE